jgi:hypothetical protein
MTKYYLQDWAIKDNIFEVLTGISSLGIMKKSQERLKISGYVVKYKEDVLAVYAENDQIFFKANSQEWDFNKPGTVMKYRRILFVETVKVIIQKQVVFSKWYSGFRLFKETIKDPTFDKIDEESMYFLQWCNHILNDPKRRTSICKVWNEWFI